MNCPSGWFIIDKPLGMTSTHVVAKIRRLCKGQKVGHAGTLDPLATGILPIAVGEATKFIPFLMNDEKEYVFSVMWGIQTTTDDSEGEPVTCSSHRPSLQDIQMILPKYIGILQQIPPMFSAIHVNGQRAYDLARNKQEFQLQARPVHIYDMTIVHHTTDETHFKVRCGKGTYIRSLARDIGLQLGCFGHVHLLRRTKVGKFSTDHAILLDKLLEVGYEKILDLKEALDGIPVVSLSLDQSKAFGHGQKVVLSYDNLATGEYIVHNHCGDVMGIATLEGRSLVPKRLLSTC